MSLSETAAIAIDGTSHPSTPYGGRMEAPYGTWSSPVDGRFVASDSGWPYTLLKVCRGNVYWSESRPAEDGRDALVVRRRADAAGATGAGATGAAGARLAPPSDVIPPEFSVRTRVHEYGGGAYIADADTVYFCNDADQRVHRTDAGEPPRPITPEPETPFGLRYADLRVAG